MNASDARKAIVFFASGALSVADEKCRDRKLLCISNLIGSEGLQVDGLFAFWGFF
jgi:hypothetical protein